MYLGKKSPKFFHVGPFFLVLQLTVYRSALILRNLPCPEKYLVTCLHWKTMKNLHTKCVYYVQKPWKKMSSCFWTYFYVSANVWLLLRVFQCFLKNGWLLLKYTNEQLLLKENVQLMLFVCVAASWKISMFFNVWLLLKDTTERLLLKSIKRKRKCATASYKLCPLKVNKSVYIAKYRQRYYKTLNNILLHAPNHVLKDMNMLNHGIIKNPNSL